MTDPGLDALYRALSPFLARLLRHMRIPERDQADVAQDVHVRILRVALRELPDEHPIRRFLRGDAHADAHMQRWMGAVALHVVLKYRRRAFRRYEQMSARGHIAAVATGSGPARQAADLERTQAVVDALDELSEPRRTVLLMHYFEGLTTQQMARELAIPEGTVFSRLRQARADMAAVLERRLGEHTRSMLDTEDLDPAVPAFCAAWDQADPDSGGQDSGRRGGAWLGLLAILLLLGTAGRATAAANTAGNANPQGGGPIGGSRSVPRPKSPALWMVPFVIFGSLVVEPCNGQPDIARTLGTVTPAVVASVPRDFARLHLGSDQSPRVQEDPPAPAHKLRDAEAALSSGRPDTEHEGLDPEPGPEAPAAEGAERIQIPAPAQFHGVLFEHSATSRKPMRQTKEASLVSSVTAVSIIASKQPAAVPPECVPGATSTCYSGPEGTEGAGICRAGTAICLEDGMGWGACEADVTPDIENCAKPEDEDCDGEAPTCSGDELWKKKFGAAKGAIIEGITVGADGTILLTGSFKDAIDFSGNMLKGAGWDGFLTKLDPLGNVMWSQQFGGADYDMSQSVAVDAAGNVFVAGLSDMTDTFPGHPFLKSIDSSGMHRWSKAFESAFQTSTYLAADSAGNAVLALSFTGQLDVGGGPMVSPNPAIALATFDPAGNYLWSEHFGDGLVSQHVTSIAVDRDGGILIAGNFTGIVDFGGTPFTSSGEDVFVVKFDRSGQHLWSKQFGGAETQRATGVAVDSAGNVLVSGYFSGTIDLGAGPLSAGQTDIFIIKLDPSGEHLWGRTFGDVNDQGNVNGLADHAMALDASDNIMWTGVFRGTVNFGGLSLVADGTARASFAVKLDPSGNHVWSKRFADVMTMGIGSNGAGNAVITGQFNDADGADPASTSVAARGISIVRLAP